MNLAQATKAKAAMGGTVAALYQPLAEGGLKMTKRKSTTSGFFEKYKHPKWQKRRLEIMEASGFICSVCESAEKTLNVHHLYYISGREPWEYEDEELVCLCEECHKWLHKKEDYFKQALNEYKRSSVRYGNFDDLDFVAGYLEGAAQAGPYRFEFGGNRDWLRGFVFGIYKQNLTKNSLHSLLDLIELDGGCIDYEWLRLFVCDSLWSENIYKHILKNGFGCPDSFPSWYKRKVKGMIDDFAARFELTHQSG